MKGSKSRYPIITPYRYHLYAFVTVDHKILLTRGRTETDAYDFLRYEYGDFHIIGKMEYLPMGANKMYEKNHEPGWFYRKPHYYEKYKMFHP